MIASAASVYVCPLTQRPLRRSMEGLVREDGVVYPFAATAMGMVIPDLRPGVPEAKRPEVGSYDQAEAVAIYDGFLAWLHQTFGTTDQALRRTLINRLRLRQGDRVLVTGCGLGNDLAAILIWPPKNGHHEICYLELVEGI